MPRTAFTAQRPEKPVTQGARPMTHVTVPPPHASCLPPRGELYRLIVPNSRTAPRIVRDFVAVVLWAADHDRLVDDARLCVSEVVSNAYRHTRSARVTGRGQGDSYDSC